MIQWFKLRIIVWIKSHHILNGQQTIAETCIKHLTNLLIVSADNNAMLLQHNSGNINRTILATPNTYDKALIIILKDVKRE